MPFSAAILGLGNIGRRVLLALEVAPDATCIGVVRRQTSVGTTPSDLRGVPDFPSFDELCENVGKPDVVIVCLPSRRSPGAAAELLTRGFCTVDGYDLRDRLIEVVGSLENNAHKGRAVAITAAGWDPGFDSVLRAMFEAMVPSGTTMTNFSRGRSLAHSVAVRCMEGVEDAAAITIPLGKGQHARQVFVLLKEGYPLEKVETAIRGDRYFAHEPLTVIEVKSAAELAQVADASHGVTIDRTGSTGLVDDQQLKFGMRIDNPAFTAQVLVCSARAAVRLREEGQYGCYTLIDVPPVLLLPGDRMKHLSRIV